MSVLLVFLNGHYYFFLKSLNYLVCVSVCVLAFPCLPQWAHQSHRTAFGSWFSPTIEVLGVKPKWSGLVADTFSHLASHSVMIVVKLFSMPLQLDSSLYVLIICGARVLSFYLGIPTSTLVSFISLSPF